MKKFKISILLLFAILCNGVAWSYPSSFNSGSGYQDVSYAGLGNPNEVLAFAEVSFSASGGVGSVTIPTNVVTVTKKYEYPPRNSWGGDVDYTENTSLSNTTDVTVEEITFNANCKVTITINYSLVGAYEDYVKRIRIWARPFDSSTSSNTSSVPNTYAYSFDYRDPEGKSDAIFIAEREDLTQTSISATLTDFAAGDYVIYLTADIRDDVELPLLTTGLTQIGGQINSVSYDIVQEEKTFDYEITTSNRTDIYRCTRYNQRNNVNNYTLYEEGTPTDENTESASYTFEASTSSNTINVTTATTYADGSRVLVPKRKIMFAPRDYYSKYYRIPAITTTSNGTLIAISDARKYYAHDVANDIDMLVRRSEDNGKTWSAPITIAKGKACDADGNEVDPTTAEGLADMVCATSVGYGDAALAALPNGKVLLTMVRGAALASSDTSLPTCASYCISNDNGLTWSAPVDVDTELYGKERGCIAPGNMCVVKEGVLAGKVFAAYRAYATLSGSYTARNYLLIFDPETDTWTRATNSDDTNYLDTGSDDEAQLVEVAENKFLISIRGGASGNRTYRLLTLSQSSDGSYKFTVSSVTSSSQIWATTANGVFLPYTTADNANYILQTVVAETATSGGTGVSSSQRSSLTIYSLKDYAGTGNLNWSKHLNISDPFNGRNETAQYSSMTHQADGTIGILFEEGALMVRNDVSHYHNNSSSTATNGDFIMQLVYMNLRIGDIIRNVTAPEIAELLPPTITPISQTYNSGDETDRPNPITISHTNTEEGVETAYSITFIGADGKSTVIADDLTFEGASKELAWDDVNALLGDKGLSIAKGSSLIVTAYCYLNENGARVAQSTETQVNYIFTTPVRKVLIKAMSVSGMGTGNPTLVGASRQVGPDVVITVGEGEKITVTGLTATDNLLVSFESFTYSAASATTSVLTAGGNQMTNDGGATDLVYMNPNQIQVTLSSNIVNNYYYETEDVEGGAQPDAICIYVWYSVDVAEVGVKSQVITNYHTYTTYTDGYDMYQERDDSAANGRTYHSIREDNKSEVSTDGDTTTDFSTGIGPWTSQYYMNATGTAGVSYAPAETSDEVVYYKAATKIELPKNYANAGLHLNVGVLPDFNTLKYLNAVIMFVNAGADNADGVYEGKYLVDETGTPIYALLQGSLHPNTALADKAAFVGDWYKIASGITYGAVVHTPFNLTDIVNKGYVERTIIRDDGTVANVEGSYTHMDNHNFKGVKFYDLDLNENFVKNPTVTSPLYVVVYIITDELTDINTLVANHGKGAIYGLYHPIVTGDFTTGIETVVTENGNVFHVYGQAGGATFTAAETTSVAVYNIMGMLVKKFDLQGSEYVELPQGIYVANGKKFVVR